MGAESVPEPSENLYVLTLLSAGECLIKLLNLVSLCLQANAQTVPQFPSRYYMPLM